MQETALLRKQEVEVGIDLELCQVQPMELRIARYRDRAIVVFVVGLANIEFVESACNRIRQITQLRYPCWKLDVSREIRLVPPTNHTVDMKRELFDLTFTESW